MDKMELIVSGHCKRKDSWCVRENADPLLLRKKARLEAQKVTPKSSLSTECFGSDSDPSAETIDTGDLEPVVEDDEEDVDSLVPRAETGTESEEGETKESAEDELRESSTEVN
jgi:hypothetical protein